jgi:hypothetical protein
MCPRPWIRPRRRLAAEGYKAKTGIQVQALYAAVGRVNLEKMTHQDVFI